LNFKPIEIIENFSAYVVWIYSYLHFDNLILYVLFAIAKTIQYSVMTFNVIYRVLSLHITARNTASTPAAEL